MLKIFVDTTVLFAAVYSTTGSAYDLIILAIEGKVQLVLSQRVLAEMERNLMKKAPDQLPVYRRLMTAFGHSIHIAKVRWLGGSPLCSGRTLRPLRPYELLPQPQTKSATSLCSTLAGTNIDSS